MIKYLNTIFFLFWRSLLGMAIFIILLLICFILPDEVPLEYIELSELHQIAEFGIPYKLKGESDKPSCELALNDFIEDNPTIQNAYISFFVEDNSFYYLGFNFKFDDKWEREYWVFTKKVNDNREKPNKTIVGKRPSLYADLFVKIIVLYLCIIMPFFLFDIKRAYLFLKKNVNK